MNESTLTQLKSFVERAVRPVRASTACKRTIREELLAHVSGVFEEESAELGDDRTALERTALRFGNPAEVTSRLQESVPASDGIWRFWEGRPEESTLRGALRLAWVTGALVLVIFGAALFATGGVSAWWREEQIAGVSGVLFLPLYLFGIAFVTHWMEKLLPGPAGPPTGWPRIGLKKSFTSAWAVPPVRVALIAGGLCLFMYLCIAGANWPTQVEDWDDLTKVLFAVLFAGDMAATSVVCGWVLVQSAAVRRRYHEEWARLPID
jgi:hypothetical protein